ncbi:hypothetical protein IVB44_21200 [Bradyrhizobium sp. 49]|nr:hypothetical protein [Bradyrhizobium sp. 84]MCK1373488.1 hypothetical protein [Bradyrhizobium sp. 49]
MARPSSLSLARKDIFTWFSEAPHRVYTETEIARVLLQNRSGWKLAASTRASDFISFLGKQGELKKQQFRSTSYDRQITRYSWGKASLYEIALSFKQRAYLCHATALTLSFGALFDTRSAPKVGSDSFLMKFAGRLCSQTENQRHADRLSNFIARTEWFGV